MGNHGGGSRLDSRAQRYHRNSRCHDRLGCQITRNLFSEVGYRLLYTDYDTTNLVYQVVKHGAQITVGLTS